MGVGIAFGFGPRRGKYHVESDVWLDLRNPKVFYDTNANSIDHAAIKEEKFVYIWETRVFPRFVSDSEFRHGRQNNAKLFYQADFGSGGDQGWEIRSPLRF